MPSPTETPPASRRPCWPPPSRPGPPPVITAKPGLARAARPTSLGQRRTTGRRRGCGRSRRPRPPDRARPARRSPRRTRSGSAAPATGRCAPSRWARGSRAAAGRWCCARPGRRAAGPARGALGAGSLVRHVAHRPSPASHGPQLLPRRRVICASGHELVLLVGQDRVAGAEVDRGHAEPAEAGHVGPAELGVGRRRRPPRRRPRPPGPTSPGSAPGAESVTSTSKPVEDLAHVGQRLLHGAVRGEAVVDRDHARVGEHVAGDAAVDERPR